MAHFSEPFHPAMIMITYGKATCSGIRLPFTNQRGKHTPVFFFAFNTKGVNMLRNPVATRPRVGQHAPKSACNTSQGGSTCSEIRLFFALAAARAFVVRGSGFASLTFGVRGLLRSLFTVLCSLVSTSTSTSWGSACSDFLLCIHHQRVKHAPIFILAFATKGVCMLRFSSQHSPPKGVNMLLFSSISAFTTMGVNMLRFSSWHSLPEGSTCSGFHFSIHRQRGQHAPVFISAFTTKGGQHAPIFISAFITKRGQHAPIYPLFHVLLAAKLKPMPNHCNMGLVGRIRPKEIN
jgi:hypothetical protein